MTLNQTRQIMNLKTDAKNLEFATRELCLCIDELVERGVVARDSDLCAIASVLIEHSCNVVYELDSLVGVEDEKFVARADRKLSARRKTQQTALEKAVNEVLSCF